MNKAKTICALIMLLTAAVVVSCTQNLTPVTPFTVNTPTPTVTATVTSTPMATATTGTANCYADFDEAPWTGWTSGGANGYLVSSMLTNCGINSTTINTTTTRNNSPGALDVNVTIAAPTGNDFLVMIENGVYPNLNVQFGVNNPSYLSYWVYPTTAAIQTYRLWFNLNGTNIDIGNSGINCPAGTWTNVVVPIPGFVGAMTVLKAVGIDMTCATATTTDVIYDSICFYQ